MLDINSILSDAIETCGFDAEEYAEEGLSSLCHDLLRRNAITSRLERAIDDAVEAHSSDIEDMLDDAISDYALEVVEKAF